MRRLEYFTVCQSVSLDAMTGEISLFHVTHHCVVRATPTRIPLLCAVGSFIDDEIAIDDLTSETNGEAQVKLNVISPGGDPINTFRRNLNSAGRLENALFRVTNIPITDSGDLIFELVVDDVTVAKHTISVNEKAT